MKGSLARTWDVLRGGLLGSQARALVGTAGFVHTVPVGEGPCILSRCVRIGMG